MKSDIEQLYIQLGTLVYELEVFRKNMETGKITKKDEAIKRYLEIIEEYGPRE